MKRIIRTLEDGRRVNISREAMAKEVSAMQEFHEGAEQEGITVEKVVERVSSEELGAVIGYWDCGDGTYKELMTRTARRRGVAE